MNAANPPLWASRNALYPLSSMRNGILRKISPCSNAAASPSADLHIAYLINEDFPAPGRPSTTKFVLCDRSSAKLSDNLDTIRDEIFLSERGAASLRQWCIQ